MEIDQCSASIQIYIFVVPSSIPIPRHLEIPISDQRLGLEISGFGIPNPSKIPLAQKKCICKDTRDIKFMTLNDNIYPQCSVLIHKVTEDRSKHIKSVRNTQWQDMSTMFLFLKWRKIRSRSFDPTPILPDLLYSCAEYSLFSMHRGTTTFYYQIPNFLVIARGLEQRLFRSSSSQAGKTQHDSINHKTSNSNWPIRS
jgi:hypothetical protein